MSFSLSSRTRRLASMEGSTGGGAAGSVGSVGGAASPPAQCDNCGAPSTFVCSRCAQARYCGRPCQRAAWKTHTFDCTTPTAAASKAQLAAEMKELLSQFGDVEGDFGEGELDGGVEEGGGRGGQPASQELAAARAIAARQLLSRLSPDWGADAAEGSAERAAQEAGGGGGAPPAQAAQARAPPASGRRPLG